MNTALDAMDILRPARTAGALRDVDFHLARHLVALAREPSAPLALAIATLSRAQGDGDICIDLGRLANQPLLGDDACAFAGITAPALADWRTALAASGLLSQATDDPGQAHDGFPLVLDAADRLYFTKYFHFEQRIAVALRKRSETAPLADDAAIDAALAVHFPGAAGIGHDPHQRAAARLALSRRLAVITGGPGTGKTTTVAKILAAMLALAGDAVPRIRLAAPTGKAAARLGESIRGAKARLLAEGIPASLVARIPEEASTLHRLIGTRPDTRRPRHHAGNPLALDTLVIDEASMIDVPLMARVVEALPTQARLVLLGDRDQLASVEAGAVLGDICAGARTAADGGSVATLVTSHRFRDDSGIGALARAINAGDPPATLAALGADGATALVSGTPAQLIDALVARAVVAWRTCLESTNVLEANRHFSAFRVLCALRDGAFGVNGLNARIENGLADAGLINPRDRFYRGRPLLVTANDYGIQLFNGDIGLAWPGDDGRLRACFVAADGTLRSFPLNRLPAHETAFAMTVHKSQGSEFDEVAMVLPDRDSPVLTRELVYTGVTRARQKAVIYGDAALLAGAVQRQVVRTSGLRDALRRDGS